MELQLQLKNIGMIKEANVKIDGLSVIAGENDTGKSTVAKALFLINKPLNIALSNLNLISIHEVNDRYNTSLNIQKLKEKGTNTYISFEKNKLSFETGKFFIDQEKILKPIFIESPIIWNLQEVFKSLNDVESYLKMIGENILIPYPFLLKDLYFQISTKIKVEEELKLKYRESDIGNIINGEFRQDERGIFYFYKIYKKQEIKIDISSVATGIKSFGILQVLLNNNRLNKNTILILDEPEVHLHPKWQLEMAKIIVELIKNGVKILVTSHSPYMIEALKRYSELENIEDKTNFYLAENGYIEHQDSLENIFEKLVLPIRELKKLKMDKYLND